MIQKNIVQPAAQRAAIKLRSQKGASITFALFLFLVCAVIGSVVLTAGTTSSGRISQMAEMDQRYYAVTSACELLKNKIGGETVTIKKEKEVGQASNIKRVVNTTDGTIAYVTVAPTPTPFYTYKTTINDGTPITTNTTEGVSINVSATLNDFLSGLMIKMMFGDEKCNTEAAMDYTLKNGNTQTGTFSFDYVNNNSDTTDVVNTTALAISGKYDLRDDGTLVLTVWSTYGGDESSADKHKYTLELTMKATIDESSNIPEKTNTVRTTTSEGWTETTTTTETKVSKITWTFGGIRKI